jgi:AMIN domain
MDYRVLWVICAVLLGGCVRLNGVSVEAGRSAAIIRHIAVTSGQPDLEIEITGTAPLTPRTQTVTNPDRLIVDFPEALPIAGLHKVLVNRGTLTAVRVGLLSVHPQVTRVVLDLTSPTQFRLFPSGNVVVVKLGGETAPGPGPATAVSTIPAATSPTSNTSVIANALPDQPLRHGGARWILPILTIAVVLALLVIAFVTRIQNKRSSRGL